MSQESAKIISLLGENTIQKFQVVLFFFFWPCHRACGVFVPRPGIKPVPPTLEVQSLNHWTTRVPQVVLYLILCYFVYMVLALIFDTYENVREEQLGELCFQKKKV